MWHSDTVSTFKFWRLKGRSLLSCYRGIKVRFTEKILTAHQQGWGRGGLRDNGQWAVNDTITELRNKLAKVSETLEKLEPQQAASKTVNDSMHKQLVDLKRQCWRNMQQSRQEVPFSQKRQNKKLWIFYSKTI